MTTNVTLKPFQEKFLVLIVLITIPLSGFGVYLIIVSLPEIVNVFHTTKSMAQLSLVTYIYGLGITPIIYGIWSDRIGRRKIFITTLILYILITLILPFSPNIYFLLGLRFLQGMAMAGPDVLIKAFLPDCFVKAKLERYVNYLTIAWAAGPIAAPLIGIYLQSQFSWRIAFYVLAAYAAIILILSLIVLPETNPHPKKLNLESLLLSFKTIICNRSFLAAIICMVAIYSIVEIFNAVGPFIVRDALKYSVIEFGHYATILGIAWLIGNTANRYHAARRNLNTVIHYRAIFIFAVSILLALLAIFQVVNVWVIMLPLIAIFYAAGLIFPNIFAIALGLFPQSAGIVSALIGVLISLGAATSTAFASRFSTDTQLPMSIIYFVLMLIFFLSYQVGLKPLLSAKR